MTTELHLSEDQIERLDKGLSVVQNHVRIVPPTSGVIGDVSIRQPNIDRLKEGEYVLCGEYKIHPPYDSETTMATLEFETGSTIEYEVEEFEVDVDAEGIVAELTDTEPSDVLEDVAETVEDKNDDYGNAYEKVGAIKRVMADEGGPKTVFLYPDGTYSTESDPDKDNEGIEYVKMADTPTNGSLFEENADGIFTRMLDKVLRAYTLTLLADGPQVDNESTSDAARDLAGYAAMLTALIENCDQ